MLLHLGVDCWWGDMKRKREQFNYDRFLQIDPVSFFFSSRDTFCLPSGGNLEWPVSINWDVYLLYLRKYHADIFKVVTCRWENLVLTYFFSNTITLLCLSKRPRIMRTDDIFSHPDWITYDHTSRSCTRVVHYIIVRYKLSYTRVQI